MSSPVVVDKSFLQGAPAPELARVFASHQVLMTEALFFELLTTKPEIRARCFTRLPTGDNPVALVQNVGPTIRWEIENNRPLVDLGNVIINAAFRFNERLVRPDFDMGTEQIQHLVSWRRELLGYVADFVTRAAQLTVPFPQLGGFAPGRDTSVIDEIKDDVCRDVNLPRRIYANARRPDWPMPEEVDERWPIIRWTQVKLLGYLDYFMSYGTEKRDPESRTMENEYLDLEYCLVGVLVGALATRDNAMAARFKALCPQGLLV